MGKVQEATNFRINSAFRCFFGMLKGGWATQKQNSGEFRCFFVQVPPEKATKNDEYADVRCFVQSLTSIKATKNDKYADVRCFCLNCPRKTPENVIMPVNNIEIGHEMEEQEPCCEAAGKDCHIEA